MRRSDLILYLGILILFLGLVSWYVSKDRGVEPVPPSDTTEDAVPEIPESPETADESIEIGERSGEGLAALALEQFDALRREGDQLAHQVWKDGLSDDQRHWLSGFSDQFIRLRDFTLSLQFLLILVFTALLLTVYHLVSSGKLKRMLRKSS